MSNTYEWAVLRAVPRVERCEFVNVGVVLYSQAADYLDAQVTSRFHRVAALDPEVDIDRLREHLAAIRALCAGDPASGANGRRSRGERFRWLIAPRSTMVQCSPVHTGLTDDPAAELTALFARMVGSP